MENHDELTDVHEALMLASDDSKEKPAYITVTAKMEQRTKDLASMICAKNGTNLSAFLRECCKGLVRDYSSP